MGSERIRIEVACALPDRQEIITLQVAAGTTAGEAVQQSGILGHFPSMGLAALDLGIFSNPVDAGHVLEAGDRVEIYRPLTIDPKEARKARAARARALRTKPG